jgi:hypothetical protein
MELLCFFLTFGRGNSSARVVKSADGEGTAYATYKEEYGKLLCAVGNPCMCAWKPCVSLKKQSRWDGSAVRWEAAPRRATERKAYH